MANTPSRDNPPRYLLLGEILRPHGVRGELRMRILTDYPERIGKLKQVYIGRNPNGTKVRPFDVTGMRMNKGYGLLKLDKVPDRDTADRLRSLYVMVPLSDAVPLEDDEFYLFQLIGLRVQTEDGLFLGTIRDYLKTGANDVYVIDSPDYGEVLFPATEETVIDHDIENGVVLVTLLDGLLPEKKSD